MKIAATSDLHGFLDDPSLMPLAEVLCICGDLCPTYMDRDFTQSLAWFLRKFCPWIEQLPYEKVFLTFGNHDFFAENLFLEQDKRTLKKPRKIKDKLFLPEKLTILMDTECNWKGKKFYGTPWCPHLYNWAFYQDHVTLNWLFDKIPENLDVLMTHCAPRFCDYGTSHFSNGSVEEYGCVELQDAIEKKQPRLSIFGHIHSGNHQPQTWNGTTYCNVSLKDEEYKPMYEPRIFEI